VKAITLRAVDKKRQRAIRPCNLKLVTGNKEALPKWKGFFVIINYNYTT
jgi:hypothetical protein